jgi:SAM-dependent methyltransferase
VNWRIKGVVQKALGCIPGGMSVNDLLQRAAGGLRNFEHEVARKVSDWSLVMGYLKEVAFPVEGARSLEIGTGWFPTFPVCFSLVGAGGCSTFDLSHHLSRRLTGRLFAALESHLSEIARAGDRSRDEVEEALRLARGADGMAEILHSLGINYYAPADATATALPPGSVDLVYSNSVLEHVPPRGIAALMKESYRVLRSGGLVVHGVNCGDHYAYFDRHITAINYLTYPERSWRFWNNKLLYQNRLRPKDLLGLAEEAGFEIVLRRQRARQELLEILPQLSIAPEFRPYSPEELCCTSVDFVARKP